MKPIVSVTVVLCLASPARAGEEWPSLEKLLELNGRKLVGGDAKLEGDRLIIHYKKPGQFEKGFEGSGLINPDELKTDPRFKDIKESAVVGRGDGDWQSRFELQGDVKLSFKVTIPAIQKGAQLTVAMNKGPRASIQTSFFQQAVVAVGGKTRRALGSKECQAPPERWFDKKHPMAVEMSHQDGKFSLKLKETWDPPPKPTDPQPKVYDPITLDARDVPGGRISFSFRKLTFLLSEVTVSGKVDREWLTRQFKDLEARKELALREPPPPTQTSAPARPRLKRDGDDKATKEKEAEEEL